MANATGSKWRFAYQMETSYGVAPTTPATIVVPCVSSTIDLTSSQLVDDSMRSDRMGGDTRAGMNKVIGELNFKHRFATYDDFLANLLRGAWAANVLKAGSTQTSMLCEDGFTDISQYRHGLGLKAVSGKISIAPDSLIPISFSFIGKSMSDFSSAAFDTTPTEAVGHKPYDSFTGAMKEGGATIAIVSSIELDISNDSEESTVVFSDEIDSVVDGNFMATGKMTLKFQNATHYNKFKNRTGSSVEFTLEDLDGNSEIWAMPKIAYTAASISKDNPKELSLVLDFNAQYDSASGTKLYVTRVAA